jgi:hypothetical protein
MSRFKTLSAPHARLPYITFEEGVEVLVVPVSEPAPYTQPGRGITRYRILVVRLLEDDSLEACQMTLPEVAADHFRRVAKHGGFVGVTMDNTTDGLRYWSRQIDGELNATEQAFVDKHRASTK